MIAIIKDSPSKYNVLNLDHVSNWVAIWGGLFDILTNLCRASMGKVVKIKHLSIPLVCALSALALTACGANQADRASGNASPANQTGVVNAGPLPDDAHRASITMADPPKTLGAGNQTTLSVRVKNLSNVTWPAFGQGPKYKVDLGNHWLDKEGRVAVMDDGRASLPQDLKAGEEVELPLRVKAPQTAGDYVLELDMVHEELAWFNSKGSQTLKVNVKIQ